MALTPEGRVKHAVKKRLKELGVWYYMPVQNGMGKTGIPDFICCVPVTITPDMVGQTVGVFAGVEAKAEGKRMETTPNQDRELMEIHRAGGVAVVVDSADQLPVVFTRTHDADR